jgi:hypothetical protein
MLASRILGQVSAAGHTGELVADPSALPPADQLDLLFVNWADREASWADGLAGWRDRIPLQDRPRVILYGPHTDLDAHAAARSAGLGPMVARSKLVADLPRLIVGAGASASTVETGLVRP